jgi:hypothetical protein
MTDLNMRTGQPPDPVTSPVEGPDHAARSTWRLAFRRFRRHRLAMGSLAFGSDGPPEGCRHGLDVEPRFRHIHPLAPVHLSWYHTL